MANITIPAHAQNGECQRLSTDQRLLALGCAIALRSEGLGDIFEIVRRAADLFAERNYTISPRIGRYDAVKVSRKPGQTTF